VEESLRSLGLLANCYMYRVMKVVVGYHSETICHVCVIVFCIGTAS